MDRPSPPAITRAFAFRLPVVFGFRRSLPGPGLHPRQRPQRGGAAANDELPLGAARAQLHENYIVAQTATGIVIVDQHAAHERLVYERLKRQLAETGIRSQPLLIPEIVDLSPTDAARLLDAAPRWPRSGL